MKGKNIISLNFKNIEAAITKYFVICTATSNTHSNALETYIRKNTLKDINEKPFSSEGTNANEWVLMDYSDVVVHIFQEKFRNYYNIEDLWGDAKITNYDI